MKRLEKPSRFGAQRAFEEDNATEETKGQQGERAPVRRSTKPYYTKIHSRFTMKKKGDDDLSDPAASDSSFDFKEETIDHQNLFSKRAKFNIL